MSIPALHCTILGSQTWRWQYNLNFSFKDLEAQRRDELGVDFETWIAAGGYFPPFA